jgi:hypothetical protein
MSHINAYNTCFFFKDQAKSPVLFYCKTPYISGTKVNPKTKTGFGVFKYQVITCCIATAALKTVSLVTTALHHPLTVSYGQSAMPPKSYTFVYPIPTSSLAASALLRPLLQ